MDTINLIEKLEETHILEKEEYIYLITSCKKEETEILFQKARDMQKKYYKNEVYSRGLIEFTDYCKNNCLYCGIRSGNTKAERYRLSQEEILSCTEEGYRLGFRTFVLQGGEDCYYSAEDIGNLVSEIKKRYPDCAVTLSIGEQEREVYQYWYGCGADRPAFLLNTGYSACIG